MIQGEIESKEPELGGRSAFLRNSEASREAGCAEVSGRPQGLEKGEASVLHLRVEGSRYGRARRAAI